MNDEDELDNTFSSYIKSKTIGISRRSFLTKATIGVFGLFGVSMLPKVSLFNVPVWADAGNVPATNWQHCGLHGRLCQGSCAPSANQPSSLGAGPTMKWTQCCQDPSCALWFCCGYADYCGKRSSDYNSEGTNCGGVDPGSSALWCGGANGQYICSEVKCELSIGYTSKDKCSCGNFSVC